MVGLLLLVIPGLILFNVLALVGPVIEVENRKVMAAIRRSIHLVRGHFWSVALLATLPVAPPARSRRSRRTRTTSGSS